ncbi:uncharacterized protein L3040_002927 [Drepanopeziza brunnea f. sp. 'multigermtubi']|uniref:uncharacterized protein n=1 Tax=Drepanopeziza brunnea f. sp. 'multigermtubi' TaxID=698441 RepID=UPI00239EBF21|nr:hypothetical protein L3040_002927 [Drepanopeziza brunnea f. sp. 'multigermtubi']
MNSSGHLENAHPPAGPLAQFDKTSRRYQQFLNYKPPPYVSPWASSSGRNVPSSTQPASKPVDTPMQALRVPQTLRNGVGILAYGSLAVNQIHVAILQIACTRDAAIASSSLWKMYQIHGSGLNFDSASKAEMHQDRSPEWAKQNPVLPESQTGKSEEKDSYRYSEGRRISGEESGMSVAAGQRNSATLAAMAPVKTEPSPSPESCRFG